MVEKRGREEFEIREYQIVDTAEAPPTMVVRTTRRMRANESEPAVASTQLFTPVVETTEAPRAAGSSDSATSEQAWASNVIRMAKKARQR